MKKVLFIQTSLFGEQGQSSQLAEQLIEGLREKSEIKLSLRDLIKDPINHFTATEMAALGSVENERTEEQQQLVILSNQLIDELQEADIILLAVPMYNFSIPSQLKSYFDLIARAGVTFRYTENGPEGLLNNKPVVLLATRGGIYKEQGLDYQLPYLKTMLNFIGYQSITEILAEGLNMEQQRAKSLQAAHKAIREFVDNQI